MTFYSHEEPDYEDSLGLAPVYVRQAHMRLRRATAAVMLYRRRGWNPSAAAHAHKVARQEFSDALDRWDFDESNPRLF